MSNLSFYLLFHVANRRSATVLEFPVAFPDAYLYNGVMHNLSDWSGWNELPKRFSGLLDYTTTLTLDTINAHMQLDLGAVEHIAQVWVNDQPVGAKIWAPFTFNTAAFKKGENTLRIRVGNLVNNNYGLTSPSGLRGPVVVNAFDEGLERSGAAREPSHE